MVKLIYTATILLIGYNLYGQDTIIQIDQGQNYSQSVFFNLEDKKATPADFTKWDIAFGINNRSASILINEATITGDDSHPLELYATSSTVFEEADISLVTDTLYNGDASIDDGAFAAVADTSNPFDFGWGLYDMNTHNLNGVRIFIIKLRDGSYKKIRIDQLQSRSSIFQFTYADLDNENKITDTINMADYQGKTLAYYSLVDQKTVDLEPEKWDLKFTRYTTPVEDIPGVFLDYHVTGVFTRPGVEVAVASKIDPANVEFEDYADSLVTDMNAIGYEWKFFDLNTFQYSILEDRAYFVKTQNNEVYKIQFIDFEGASTGVITMRISLEEVISALAAPQDYISKTILFPNPAIGGQSNIKFESEELRQNAQLRIINSLGQEVYAQKINILRGSNIHALPQISIPGLYYVTLRTEDGVTALPLLNK